MKVRIFALAFVLAFLGTNRPEAGAVWLHLTDELTLIVISPLGREWKFHYDLSKIK